MSKLDTWTKSSFSNGSGGNNCVEAIEMYGEIYVRNSNHPDDLPTVFSRDEWTAFVAGVKAGEFDIE